MTLKYENQKQKQGYRFVIGCDEVGRGSLAGPVVACALVFDRLKITNCKLKIKEVRDSKELPAERRPYLVSLLKQCAVWSIGVVSQNIIDKINIHHATLLAMRRAVEGLLEKNHPASYSLGTPPCQGGDEDKESPPFQGGVPRAKARGEVVLLIDGPFTIPNLNLPQEPIIDGDNKVLSIAAASIVAKVYRDQLMRNVHQDYPIYNFAQHKGYGTLYHRKMIIQHGLSPLHRLSFCGHLCR